MSCNEWPRAVYQEVLYGVQEIMLYVTGFESQDTDSKTNFRQELDLDMVSILEVIVMCEDRFRVKIPHEQKAQLNTVDDLVRCILDLQNQTVVSRHCRMSS